MRSEGQGQGFCLVFGVSLSRIRKVHPSPGGASGSSPTAQRVLGFSRSVSLLIFLLLPAPIPRVFPSPGGVVGSKVSIPPGADGVFVPVPSQKQVPTGSIPLLQRCQDQRAKTHRALPREEWAFRVKKWAGEDQPAPSALSLVLAALLVPAEPLWGVLGFQRCGDFSALLQTAP